MGSKNIKLKIWDISIIIPTSCKMHLCIMLIMEPQVMVYTLYKQFLKPGKHLFLLT